MFLLINTYQTDFEGKTDDKIKAMEVVEELRSKRADMQVLLWNFGYRFYSYILWVMFCEDMLE
jgi:hypothetical protein